MTTIKTRDIISGLQNKGFRTYPGDHIFLIFHLGEKKTSIRTKVSHGVREIGDSLISVMASQTKLDKKDFKNLVDCPMSIEQYILHLRESGIPLE